MEKFSLSVAQFPGHRSNPDFIMERDKTLMQGDDHCNHRYIDTT